MADEASEEKFTISPMDGKGRMIAPEILSVANQISRNALRYGERALGDPAVVSSLLEESAASVSCLLHRPNNGGPAIRSLRAYLFRAFVNRVNRVRRREALLLKRLSEPGNGNSELSSNPSLDFEILVDEILSSGDPVMRDMFRRRSQGYSWKEIGSVYGISAHAAEARFSQSLRRIRRRIEASRQRPGERILRSGDR
jgi:DNA-directed RNA polymerase specialized sigma24 family protein